MITRADLDELHETYCQQAQIAEWNIGKPGEAALWKRADKTWAKYTMLKTDFESQEKQAAADAAAADYNDTLESFLAGTQ